MDDLAATLTLLFASHKADDMAKAIRAAVPAAEQWNFLRSLNDEFLIVPVFTIGPEWIEEGLDLMWDDTLPKKRIKPGCEEAVFKHLCVLDIDDKIFEAMHYHRDEVLVDLEKAGFIEPVPDEVTNEGG